MNTHESIRTILPLAAAGALDPQEMRQVEQHIQSCEECLHEQKAWGVYAAGLRHLPQPAMPSHLIARTRARVLREHENAVAMRSSNLMFGSLALYSWIMNLAVWSLARVVTGGRFEVLGANLVSPESWFLVSFVVGGMTAAAAALTLKHHGELRRIL